MKNCDALKSSTAPVFAMLGRISLARVLLPGLMLMTALIGQSRGAGPDHFRLDGNLVEFGCGTQSGYLKFITNQGLTANEKLFGTGNRDLIFEGPNGLGRDGNRLKFTKEALYLLATQPDGSGSGSRESAEDWLKGVGVTGKALDHSAKYLDAFKMNYWDGNASGADLHNFMAKHLRRINPRTVDGVKVPVHNLQKFSMALEAVPVLTDIAGAAVGAGLRLAIESDMALYRLDLIEEAVAASSDPVIQRAVDQVRSELEQSDSYYHTFLIELTNRRADIAAHAGRGALMIVAKAAGAHGMFVVGLTFELIAAQMDQHAAAQLATIAATLEEPIRVFRAGQARPIADCERMQAAAYARFIYFERMKEAVSIFPDWAVGLLPESHSTREALVYYQGMREEYLADYERLAERSCLPAPPAGGESQGDCSAGQDVVLILDSSGSMAGNDPRGMRRDAGALFADRMAASGRIAVVDFDSQARVVAGLSTDRGPVHEALRAVDADGGTNITRALDAGLKVLETGQGASAALLFTDGQSSDQDGGDAYAGAGIPVHIVGLGSEVNAEFLTRLASETGGIYLHAAEAGDLMGAFDQIIADLSCEGTLLSIGRHFMPGQVEEFGFSVDDQMSGFTCRLTWGGSRFGMEVLDPTGAATGSVVASGATYSLVRVDAAQPGSWKVRVTAEDVPSEGEECMLRIGGPSDLRVTMAARADDSAVLRLALQTPSSSYKPTRQWSRVDTPDGATIEGNSPREVADGLYDVLVPVTDSGVYRVTAGLGGQVGGTDWNREISRTIVVGEGAVAWRGTVTRIEGAYATINRGRVHGMRPGLEITFGDPGSPAGRGHLLSSLDRESTVEIEELLGGQMCQVGMPAEVNVRQWMGDNLP